MVMVRVVAARLRLFRQMLLSVVYCRYFRLLPLLLALGHNNDGPLWKLGEKFSNIIKALDWQLAL